MTYGTLAYGFFRDSDQFKRKVMYWHVIPSCSEMGFKSAAMPAPESLACFAEGSRTQDQLIFVASAAEMVKNRPLN